MIYFDNAATTPISEEVRKSMCPFLAGNYGNPSSVYRIGRESREIVFKARETAAKLLGASAPTEIIFTSGATESNNLALKGVAFYASQVLNIKPHIIVSSIEHHSVLDTAKYLEKHFGFEVTYLPVSKEGIVSVEDIKKEMREDTVLVSVMTGNNEVGSIQPIAEIGKFIAAEKEFRKKAGNEMIYFHTDAVQAFQYLDSNVNDLGVDLLSLTAHKFNGPKGVGLLYIRRGTKLLPQQQGGAQERGIRAGTENVPYIVGMAKAMELAAQNRDADRESVRVVTDYLIKRVAEIPEIEVLGPKDFAKRLPHIANLVFKRIEGESVLINLDMLDIAASSGSACTSGSLEPSHVTKAMGYSDLLAHGAVRFSLCKNNKKEEVDELMKHLPQIVEKLRAMSPIE